ncbi:hypothetical protein ACRN9A_15850 [Shewanella frigidimarina]|uniref:hypothetical protein n=1 Tax=Shewanella frigidimarina TaxID=56812 RepID=UPI003D7C08BC
MSNLKPKKTGSQPAKIEAARQKALNKAIKQNLSLMRGKELPVKLRLVGGGFCGQRLLWLIYQEPLLNTHQINERLRVSNAHDISKKLSKRLARAGYKIEKLPLEGTQNPYYWQLREVDYE